MKGKGKCKSLIERETGEAASEKVNRGDGDVCVCLGEKVRPWQTADSRNYSQGFLHSINSTRHFEDDLCVSYAQQIYGVSSPDERTGNVCFCNAAMPETSHRLPDSDSFSNTNYICSEALY